LCSCATRKIRLATLKKCPERLLRFRTLQHAAKVWLSSSMAASTDFFQPALASAWSRAPIEAARGNAAPAFAHTEHLAAAGSMDDPHLERLLGADRDRTAAASRRATVAAVAAATPTRRILDTVRSATNGSENFALSAQ